MNPNAALLRFRELATAYWDGQDLSDTIKLVECMQALDTWVSNGGDLPDEWAAGNAAGGPISENDAIQRATIATMAQQGYTFKKSLPVPDGGRSLLFTRPPKAGRRAEKRTILI